MKNAQQIAAASLVVAAKNRQLVIQKAFEGVVDLGTIFESVYPLNDGDPPTEVRTVIEALRDPRFGFPAQIKAIDKLIAALERYA